MAQVLLDTGPLVAIFSGRDSCHSICVEQLRYLDPPLLTCWPVITEAAWLLRNQPTALQALLNEFETGLLRLLELDETAVSAIRKFLVRYEEIGAQLADASLMYLAEREGITRIFTLDRRDFSVYRTRRNRRLQLLPAPDRHPV